jgi:hypothetical protein
LRSSYLQQTTTARTRHPKGVPHLPIKTLSRKQTSDWIDDLKTVVGEGGRTNSSSFRHGTRESGFESLPLSQAGTFRSCEDIKW